MLVVYCNKGDFTCDLNNKINDIFESDDVIVTVGISIDIFQFDINNKTIYKKNSILLTNNIPNNNNNIIAINNNNFNNEILCIELADDKYLVCGHSSGLISFWKPLCNEPFMQKLQDQKLHNSHVNKILYLKLQNVNYIYTCSNDKNVKKYCLDTNQCEKTANFDSEVLCIKKIEEFYSQEQYIRFIISLKNGELYLLDTDINVLLKIPSRFNTKTVRQVLSIDNPGKNDKKGNFLLISEGNKIEIFFWIKEDKNQNQGNHISFPRFPGEPLNVRGGRGGRSGRGDIGGKGGQELFY